MHSFEVEIDAMKAAQDELGRHREALERYRQTAANLTDSVPRSTAPRHDRVADKLHEIYQGRAGADGGVQAVLEDYLEELDQIQNTIKVTLEAYAAGEQQATARYQPEAN